jgi:glycosyltransferase involved in cell wall biosynthesis
MSKILFINNINIYYFHPLNLTFKSAQTIQILRDYFYLSKLSYKIYIYGVYDNKDDLDEILNFIKNSNIKLYHKQNSKLNKMILKIKFLYEIYKEKNKKLLITRSLNKTKELLKLSFLFSNHKIIQELHEEAFPHLLKNKPNLKAKFEKYIKKIDGVIFTNYSQQLLFKKEYDFKLKNSVVLPNGVEIEKYSQAKQNRSQDKIILTYLGQFNKWKNVELLFSSLALLEERYILKIAGGKGDKKSKEYINNFMKKYNIDKKRVIYMGFVNTADIIKKVLDNSHILLLPLGDNIQSKYLTSPMKLFEYMATSIPVLAVDYPSVNMLLEDDEIYLCSNNKFDFSKAIIDIIDNKQDKKIEKMNKLSLKYSYTNRSLKFNEFIQKNIFTF